MRNMVLVGVGMIASATMADSVDYVLTYGDELIMGSTTSRGTFVGQVEGDAGNRANFPALNFNASGSRLYTSSGNTFYRQTSSGSTSFDAIGTFSRNVTTFVFSDDDTAYATGGSSLFTTTDGGANWSEQSISGPGGILASGFIDSTFYGIRGGGTTREVVAVDTSNANSTAIMNFDLSDLGTFNSVQLSGGDVVEQNGEHMFYFGFESDNLNDASLRDLYLGRLISSDAGASWALDTGFLHNILEGVGNQEAMGLTIGRFAIPVPAGAMLAAPGLGLIALRRRR